MGKKSVRISTPHPDGDWMLDVELAVVNERVECVGLALRSAPGRKPRAILTSDTLKRTPLQRIVSELRVDLRDELLELAGVRLPQSLSDLADVGLGPLADRRRPPGRPERSAEDCERAADIYNSTRQAPTQAVADQMSMSHSGTSKLVADARRRGLIPPTTQGRRS
jgi:hypothetical protein